jgi:hypothetical protein
MALFGIFICLAFVDIFAMTMAKKQAQHILKEKTQHDAN